MKSYTCHIRCSTFYLFVLQLVFLTQIAGGHSCVHASLFARQQLFQTNPVTTPLAFVQQADAKAFITAPRRFASRCPYFHLPRAERATRQLFASIGNPQLLVTLYLSRIPHFALIVTNYNLIGRLAHVLFVACDLPRETGLGSINA